MAEKLEITDITKEYIIWELTLNEPFNTTYYRCAGISLSPVSYEQVSQPEQAIVIMYAQTVTYVPSGQYTKLTPGKEYTLYGFAQAANGKYYPIGSGVTITIPTDIDSPPPKPKAPYISSRVTISTLPQIMLGCNTEDYVGDIEWRFYFLYDNGEFMLYGTEITSSNNFLMNNLSFGTTYKVQVRVYYVEDENKEYPSDWSDLKTINVQPDSAVLNCYSATKRQLNQIRVTQNASNSEYSFTDTTVRVSLNNSDIHSDDNSAFFYPSESSVYKDYSGLSDGKYTVEIHTYYNDVEPVDENGNAVYKTITSTATTISRPEQFLWTEEEINAFENNGEVTTITYSRYNNFLDYVASMLSYKGKRYDEIGYNSYGIAENVSLYNAVRQYGRLTNTNKTLTANKFNIANFCINQMVNTGIVDKVGISDVESGKATTADLVYGKYFTEHFADRLNGI